MTATVETLPIAARSSIAALAVTDACTACGACLATCPEHALRPAAADGGPPVIVLADKCTLCWECIEICPRDAFVEIETDSARRGASTWGNELPALTFGSASNFDVISFLR